MNTAFLHKILLINIVYGNDDLFPRQVFCGHVNLWFGLTIAFDNLLDVINVFCFKKGKKFFDFEDIPSVAACLGSLSI